MTLGELLRYLEEESGYPVLEGTPEETLRQALAGKHKNALVGEMVAAIANAAPSTDVKAIISRADATTSLGAIRLRNRRDDAPIEGLRTVEGFVHAIDSAFNDEALAARHELKKS